MNTKINEDCRRHPAMKYPIYQTHFDLGMGMGLIIIFKMSLTAGGVAI